MTTIEFEGLNLRAQLDGSQVEVLRDISFGISRGGTLGLVGESGAGKSMIARVISGLLPTGFSVSAGRLTFKGTDLLAMDIGRRRSLLGKEIAFIPQEPLTALNPVRTIGDQFNEHLAHLGVPRGKRDDMALEQLASVKMPNPQAMLGRYPHELSGGQCQRVLIAMAFSGDPALVVADEPTTALDVVTQAHVIELIAEKQARHGTAMLFITHDLHLAAQVCENVAVMYAGDIVEFGPADAVLHAPTHPYTRALLDAIPSMQGERHLLPAMNEQMPGLKMFAGLPGCRFASRCSTRDAACLNGTVQRMVVASGHWAGCSSSCAAGASAQAKVPMPVPLPVARINPQAVVFNNVSLTYTSSAGWLGTRRTSFDAVKSVSFEVAAGEMVGIVGESGSGKTSIGRLIVGLERPTAGLVSVNRWKTDTAADGVYISGRDAQMIFQDPQSALNPRRSVMKLLTQALEGRDAVAIDPRVEAERLARSVKLPPDCIERFPSELSGGQKQRVNIGRALCLMPKILVADEIVSGLDVSVQAHVLNLLIELNRKHGITVILISHDLAVVRYLCSRVILVNRGEIVEQGPTAQVFERPQHEYTRQLINAVPSGHRTPPHIPSAVSEHNSVLAATSS